MTLRHRATHSRIRVADRSRGCTQTASWRHFDSGRPANGLPIARTSPAHGLHTDCRRAVLQASSNWRSLWRTKIAMPIHAGAAAESFPGRSRTARRFGMTTWPRRSRLWRCPFCRMSGTFVPARQSESSITDAMACWNQWPAGAILTEANISLAESARSMHVTHRPSLARAPKPARSPESRWPQGLEVAVSGSSSLDQLHAIQ